MNPNEPNTDSQQVLPHEVDRERMDYLWGRLKQAVFTISRLSSMQRKIQLYGSSQMTYVQKRSKTQVIQISSKKKDAHWVILPSSRPRRCWLFVMFLLMLYTATITPYRICIVDESDLNWMIIETCVDCFFMLDVLMSFFTAYYDADYDLIIDRRQIFMRYLTGWFLVDAAASVPFQLFETDNNSQSQQYNKLMRLMRLPRLYKLMRLARLVKLLKMKPSEEERLLKLLRMNRNFLHLLKFISGYLILVHILACLWYYTSKIDDDQVDTWPMRYGLVDKSTAEVYVASLYWVLTTLATVGYGDITAYTMLERSFAIVVMIACVAFFSYSISNFSSIVSSSDIRSANLTLRLTALDDFSQAVSLPDDLKQRAQRTIM